MAGQRRCWGKEGCTRLSASWVRRAQAVLKKRKRRPARRWAEIRWWLRWMPRFVGKTGRREAEALLVKARPGLESWMESEGRWRFSREWMRRAEALLGAIAEKGSPSLKAELTPWQERVLKWEGRTLQGVWEELLQREREER